MNRPVFILLFVAVAAISDTSRAQTNPNLEIGLKPYGAYDSSDFDTVSVANGNVFVHIPLVSYPQRGSLTEKLYMVSNGKNFYVSQVCNSRLGTCTSSWQWGNNPYVPGPPQGPGTGVSIVDQNFLWVHWQFVNPNNWATVYTWDGGSHQMAQLTGGDLEPFDGSVLRYKSSNGGIIDSSGNVIGSTDPNGNYFSGGTIPPTADTMGRNLYNVLFGASTTDYTGCAGALPTTSASILSGPGVNGGTLQIKLCYANGSVKTSFSAYDYDPYGNKDRIQELQATEQFLQTVIVYDGSSWTTGPKWTFAYDAGVPGNTNVHYGDLLSGTLPTGGTISYTWSTQTFCGSRPALIPVSRIVTSRTVNANDGLGNLTTTYGSGGIVTDPAGNDTVHVITALGNTCSLYDTEVDFYQGSHTGGTLLKKVLTTYQYQTNPFDHIGDGTTSTVTNVYPTQITTVWPNSQQSQVQMTYDANLTATAPAVGGTANYTMSYGKVTEGREYDYGGALLRKTDYAYLAFNNSSYLTANMLDRIASETVYNGSGTQVAQTTYGYDEYGVQSTSTPQHGAPPFSVRGNRTSVRRWLNTTGGTLNTTTTYFDTGMSYQVTDPKGNVTTYAYSSTYDGTYVTQTTMPATGSVQHVVSATYDYNSGKVTSFTDQNGQVSNYGYDTLWRLTSGSYPNGGQTSYNYYSSSAYYFTEKMDTAGNYRTTYVASDGLGRQNRVAVWSGEATPWNETQNTCFDANGRVSLQGYPFQDTGWGNPFSCSVAGDSYTYDALGRTTKATHSDGSYLSTSYSGPCSSVTDEQGVTRESCMDGLGRLTQVIENPGGLNYVTNYGYDALNNLTNGTQNGSHSRSFVYDSLSRLTTATNPESGATRYTYDGDGNVATRTDARNITTTYSYDAENRLTSKAYSDGTPGAYYYYDQSSWSGVTISNGVGRLTSQGIWNGSNWLVSSGSSYDAMGRVINNPQWQVDANTIYQIPYTYNLIGEITSYTNGAGITINYNRDAAGYARSVTSNWSDSQHPPTLVTVDSNIGYWPTGAMRLLTFANGLTEDTMYDVRWRPCRINVNTWAGYLTACNQGASGSTIDFTVSPSANGNIASFSAFGAQVFNRSYTYDALNRIYTMSAPGDTCSGLQWTIDPWGNRTNQTATGGTCYTFNQSVDGNNHLTASPYQYDAAGNMTHDASHSYTYDAENRVTKVDGGSTATYVYDSGGRRANKVVSSVETDYYYDLSGHVIATYGGGCGVTCWNTGNIYLNGALVAIYTNGTTYFVVADHLGSTRLVTGYPTPSIVECDDYYPHGEPINCGANTLTPLKFTRKERDAESGVDNFGARYNSSQMGRFMSPDPLGGKLADPQTLNKYSYVRNNPLTLTDPTGLYTINCTAGVKNCEKQEQNFDKALTNALKSKDASVRDAAAAYGPLSKQAGDAGDNGVNVSLAKTVDAQHPDVTGQTTSQPGTGGLTYNAATNTFRQATQVTIKAGLGSDTLEETAIHEGVHVEDRDAFVNSLSVDLKTGAITMNNSLNITARQSEINAYGLENIFRQSMGLPPRSVQDILLHPPYSDNPNINKPLFQALPGGPPQ